MKTKAPRDIDEYAAGFPPQARKALQQIRKTIAKAAPGAVEAISYQIPTFKLEGKNLIHFAAYAEHIGLYPAPGATGKLAEEIARYLTGKATLRLPLDRPMPLDLVRRVVERRIEESASKVKKARR